MAQKRDAPLELRTYLAKARGGITKEYRKKQIIFSQGLPADAVFYIEKGKVKLTVLSAHGKEAVVAIVGGGISLVKGAWQASRFAWPRRPRGPSAPSPACKGK